jgi:hypothetical protein
MRRMKRQLRNFGNCCFSVYSAPQPSKGRLSRIYIYINPRLLEPSIKAWITNRGANHMICHQILQKLSERLVGEVFSY